MDEAVVMRSKLGRAEAKIAELESMIENKTRELYLANQAAMESNQWLRTLHQTMPGAVVVVNQHSGIQDTNTELRNLLGFADDDLIGRGVARIWPAGVSVLDDLAASGPGVTHRSEAAWMDKSGQEVPVLVSIRILPAEKEGAANTALVVGMDLRQRRELEIQRRHAQKMESVGQLAAGIAHEINTPMQYVNDNLFFLRDAAKDLAGLLDAYRALLDAPGGVIDAETADRFRAMERDIDLDYIRENMQDAFCRSIDGVERVAQIVRAVKSFSRNTERTAADLNEGIRTTLEIARNEYKYCAVVRQDLGQLPMVDCNPGEINQAVLNLIVNAAHAIEDSKAAREPGSGRIDVRTSVHGDWAVIEVEDNGCGIPPEVKHRIFDPFFTTKEIGRGTGQGLSIVHNLIVKNHGGAIELETEVGKGTTFRLRLPLKARQTSEVEA